MLIAIEKFQKLVSKPKLELVNSQINSPGGSPWHQKVYRAEYIQRKSISI